MSGGSLPEWITCIKYSSHNVARECVHQCTCLVCRAGQKPLNPKARETPAYRSAAAATHGMHLSSTVMRQVLMHAAAAAGPRTKTRSISLRVLHVCPSHHIPMQHCLFVAVPRSKGPTIKRPDLTSHPQCIQSIAIVRVHT